MKIKRIAKIVLIILGAIFLIIGVPIIINECYKANFGYSTVWNGADALGYYGTILGSVIAVVTLAVKIDFAFMETFISAIKKLAIKDVVLYSDQKIKATKNVIKAKDGEV